ncbi:MAG: hypothetical protein ACLFR1_00235 [Spirochaetia bacterium]
MKGVKKLILSTILFFILPLFIFPVHRESSFQGFREFQTEHFVFIYEPRDEEYAEAIIRRSEDVYDRVTSFFGVYPENIHVRIHGRTDTANGSFGFPPDQINLYLTSPSFPWLGARTEDWLSMLLTHELTHYVHLNGEEGIFHQLSYLFGPFLDSMYIQFLPGWVIEGITTYLETELTSGGRGRNPFFEMQYKALILEDRLFSPGQAGYFSPFPPSGRIYTAGYLLIDHIQRTYGEDTFIRIHSRFQNFPFFGIAGAIENVTGDSFQEIFRDMQTELEQEFREDSAVQGGEDLFPGIYENQHRPVVTEKGWVIYQSGPYRQPRLAILDPETQEVTESLNVRLYDFTSFTASPDGRYVYYSALEHDFTFPALERDVSDIYRWDTESGAVVQITENMHVWHPAVSADGNILVGVRKQGPYSSLVEIDQETGEVHEIAGSGEINIFNPAFAPEGSQIVFALNDHGRQDLYTIERTEETWTEPQLVFSTPEGSEYFPLFASEDRILYTGDYTGDLAIYEYTLGSDQGFLVQEDPVGAFAAVLDENRILYTSYTSFGYTVKTAEYSVEERGAISSNTAPNLRIDDNTETEEELSSDVHRGFPEFYGWLPTPLFVPSIEDPMQVYWGVGGIFMGGSYTNTSSYQLIAGYLPEVNQPIIQFQLSTRNPWGFLDLQLQHDYTVSSQNTYLETYNGLLQYSYPFIQNAGPRSSSYLSAGFQAGHEYNRQGNNLFSLLSFDPSISVNQFSSVGIFVQTGWNGLTSNFDLYGGNGLNATIQEMLYYDYANNGVYDITDAQISARLKSILEHQVFSFFIHGVKAFNERAVYYLSSPVNTAYTSLPQGNYAASLALGYHIPIALTDWHLFYHFSFQGIGAAFYAETALSFLDSLSVNQDIYISAELKLIFGINLAQLPIRLGFRGRVNRNSPGDFSVIEDLRPYITF